MTAMTAHSLGVEISCDGPADAADALYSREEAEEITAAINYALGNQP